MRTLAPDYLLAARRLAGDPIPWPGPAAVAARLEGALRAALARFAGRPWSPAVAEEIVAAVHAAVAGALEGYTPDGVPVLDIHLHAAEPDRAEVTTDPLDPWPPRTRLSVTLHDD